jgi:hypothetical protein
MARQIEKASYRTNFVVICFWVPIVLFSSYQIISRSEQNEIIHETELKHPNITNGTSTNYISYIDKDAVNANINDEDKNEDNDDDVDVASRIRKTDVFHFCGDSRVQVMDTSADNDNDDDMIPDTDKTSLSLLYQCSGEPYEQFADILHSFADNRSITSSSIEKKKDNDEDGNYKYSNSSSANNKNTVYWKRKEEGDQCSALVPSYNNSNILWGKREFPLDDNMTILAIGNSHLRQISKTIACQYAHKLKRIHFLPSIRDNTANTTDDDGDNDNDNNIESFFLEFSNNARWISVTNQVVLYSEEWKKLLEEFYLNSLHPSSSSSSSSSSASASQRSTGRGAGLLLEDIDTIIFGKFTTYKQAKGTNFERTMNDEEQAYNDYRKRHDTTQQQQQEESNYSKRILFRKKGGNKGTRTTTNTLTTGLLNSNNNASTTTTNTAKVADPVIRQTTVLMSTPIINFESILPPDIVDIARIYNGPIISISMFSKSYTLDAQSSYDTYRQQCLLLAENKEEDSNNTTAISSRIDDDDDDDDDAADCATVGNINKNLYLIDSRRYIIEMGIECGTDDKKSIGTCHEPPSIKSLEDRGNQTTITNSTTIQRYRDSSDMHRCAGARGGHTDLVAWDVIESLYDTKKIQNA